MEKDHQHSFEYDLSSPIEAISSLVEKGTQGDLHELSYRLPGCFKNARAWLMVPRQSGPSPFVVALHGGGQDCDAFLAEAGLTAELGIASLLIDLPQARAFPDFSRPDQDRDRFAETVISVRRGLDSLSLRPDIDMSRGAIVGFSFGAWIASIVAAVDARLKRVVFIAGVLRMSEFWRNSPHPDILRVRQGLEPSVMDNYAEASRGLDASEYLQRCSNIPLLFQFGSGDELITQEHVREFTPYLCGMNQLKVYESGSHYQMLLNPDARRDRLSWLRDQLSQSQ
jgi:dienelactone hydrolase